MDATTIQALDGAMNVFQSLTIDDACGRRRRATFQCLHLCHQHRVDDTEQSVVTHPVEMVLHRCKGWKFLP